VRSQSQTRMFKLTEGNDDPPPHIVIRNRPVPLKYRAHPDPERDFSVA